MALSGYGVLVGAVVGKRSEVGQQTPHYQIQVRAAGIDYRIAVNVRSAQNPPDLLYVADEAFDHPLLAALGASPEGFNPVPSRPGGMALDYIRGNLFDRMAMRALPGNTPGPDNDLSDKLEHFIGRAISDPSAVLYAFGQRWGPENTTPDKIFGFTPGNGVHDIHMNQGNSGRFTVDDGVWQDGGLLLHFPNQNQWVAIFLAFQSQAWHTDDTTGHTSTDVGQPGPGPQPGPGEPDHQVRIVGALVNPTGPAPEAETVTLLNASSQDVDLAGWAILDRNKQRMTLPAQSLAAGATIRILVQSPVQLSNQGGIITLLNPAGLKVDGVAYTKDQASAEGWTITF
jgi:uncharacterized protein YukJ